MAPFDLARLKQALRDLDSELTHQTELKNIRDSYLAAVLADLTYGVNSYEPDAISGGEIVPPPPRLGYTEVSDEPECSGNNPLTMLNWRVEDGGGAFGLC